MYKLLSSRPEASFLILHALFAQPFFQVNVRGESCSKWLSVVSNISHDFTAQLEMPVKGLMVKKQQ